MASLDQRRYISIVAIDRKYLSTTSAIHKEDHAETEIREAEVLERERQYQNARTAKLAAAIRSPRDKPLAEVS
jgi:hypothetical protein